MTDAAASRAVNHLVICLLHYLSQNAAASHAHVMQSALQAHEITWHAAPSSE